MPRIKLCSTSLSITTQADWGGGGGGGSDAVAGGGVYDWLAGCLVGGSFGDH